MSVYIMSFKFEAKDDEAATHFAESSAMLVSKLQVESFSDSVSEVGIAITRVEEEVAGE
jgi:ubiquinone biosynthesis protein UbiJ